MVRDGEQFACVLGRRDGFAVDEFPEEGVFARVTDCGDVGVVQLGDGAGFLVEAAGEHGSGELAGDGAVEPRIMRFPHFAHAVGADGRKQFSGPRPASGLLGSMRINSSSEVDSLQLQVSA